MATWAAFNIPGHLHIAVLQVLSHSPTSRVLPTGQLRGQTKIRRHDTYSLELARSEPRAIS